MEVSAGGVEQFAALASGQGGERHRGVRGPVGGGADVADARDASPAVPERRGDHADRVDAGGLALVVGGADRGVALDVLHASACRHRWSAARRPRSGRAGSRRSGGASPSGSPSCPGTSHSWRVGADGCGSGGSAARRLRRDGSGRSRRRWPPRLRRRCLRPGSRSRAKLPRPAPTICWFGTTLLGTKADEVVVPAQLALPLGVQVHHRAPAAGDGQQVAGDLVRRPR